MGGSLTKRDIAIAAGVTRQAVTNWCRRPTVRGVEHPFPRAITAHTGVEMFDRDEVLAWLSATGRGRNTEAVLDAPALTPPDGATLEDAVALLALRSQIDDDLTELTTQQVAALAASVDPEDRALASEVASAAGSPALRQYVDELIAASFGAADALSRLMTSRLNRDRQERGLTDEALALLGAIAGACLRQVGADAIALRAPDSVLATTGEDVVVLTPDDRGLRRRLMIRGAETTSSATRLVNVAALVGMSEAQVLDRVDDLADELHGDDVAVVLGPSSVLCDRLSGDGSARRRSTLAVGNLVAAVRLPRGWWREAHRQALGLWVLQGGTAQRSPFLADLTGQTVLVQDVVDDVLGALEQSRGRRFRYGRRQRYDRVVAGNPLVPPGMAAAHLPGSDLGHGNAVTAASLVTAEPMSGFDVLVAPGRDGPAAAPRSLGQMLDERSARRLSGSRIDRAHTEPGGTTRILSADPADALWRIDPLVAAEHYDRARRTEPGDIVIAASPRPCAVVDDVGGALVRSPSVVVRLGKHAEIGPHTLAAWINQLRGPAPDWRAWPVPRLPADQVDVVESTLLAAAAHVTRLRHHQTAMENLVHHLVQGAAVGDLVLDPPTARKKVG